ncbi:MAG: DUF5711 family protein [[Clostridium] scindens]
MCTRNRRQLQTRAAVTLRRIQEDGLKGEIHTTLPIEKINVSEQGIVGAILKNDASAKVMCYDTAGNVLSGAQDVLKRNGVMRWIVLLSSTKDWRRVVQVVPDLYAQEDNYLRVAYSNFGGEDKDGSSGPQLLPSSGDTVMASGFFRNMSTSVAIGDFNCLPPWIRRGSTSLHKIMIDKGDPRAHSMFRNISA